MNKIAFLIFIILALMVGSQSVFTVKQTELALLLQLGKVKGSEFEPGLHFKIPFIQRVRKFDKRIQTLDSKPQSFLTAEKKNLMVDSFVKWRITDAEKYFITTSGNEQSARQRIDEIVADGLRNEFGKRSVQEAVSGDRAEIMDLITLQANDPTILKLEDSEEVALKTLPETATASTTTESEALTIAEKAENGKRKTGAKKFGIEVVDVRIKRIELPPEVSSSVYSRMEAERERVAKELRSRGEASAVRIRAKADRQSVEVIAEAERDAEKIRGEGDAKAAEVYANAYTQNTEFYGLYRSLSAYRKSFANKDDVLLLEPNSDFFNYFKGANNVPNTVSKSIPMSEPLGFAPNALRIPPIINNQGQ